MISYVAVAVLQLVSPPVESPDTASLLRDARRAEVAYERAARTMAPLAFGGGGSGDCDEVVGRFCLRFDSGTATPIPPEPARIAETRRSSIERLRAVYAELPGEISVAGALVRLLVEDGRAEEALAIALTFGAMTPDTVWAALLPGFAAHAANDDSLASAYFDTALQRMDRARREAARSLEWLVSIQERARVRRLDDEGRATYAERLWLLSDPLYLTLPNEREIEHLSRYVWSRLLERVPPVRDRTSWGRDLEELTVRYGVPRGRTREPGWAVGSSSLIEHYDDHQLAYVPESLLTRGLPPQPLPGESWPLEEERARSAYAARSFRRLLPLEHQVTRIPTENRWLLRIDARMVLDSAARQAPPPPLGSDQQPPAPEPVAITSGLFVLDSTYALVAEARASHRLMGDTADFTATAPLPAGAYVYSVEAFEPETRTGARARYTVQLDGATEGLRLADILVAAPFRGSVPDGYASPDLRARAQLILQPFDTIGIFASLAGLKTRGGAHYYDVTLTVRAADRASLPARLVGWLGQRLGLANASPPPQLRWSEQSPADAEVHVAVDLPLAELDAGLYLLEMTVRDNVGGDVATSQRLLRVE